MFRRLSAVFQRNLAQRTLQTGPDQNMVQNTSKINTGDQFECHFVTFSCSTPKTKIQNPVMSATQPKEQVHEYITPSDPGRKRTETLDLPREMAVRTLPRDPPRKGAKNKNKKKLIHKYIHTYVCMYMVTMTSPFGH